MGLGVEMMGGVCCNGGDEKLIFKRREGVISLDGLFRRLISGIEACEVNIEQCLRPTNYIAAREEFLGDEDLRQPKFQYARIEPEKRKWVLKELRAIREQLSFNRPELGSSSEQIWFMSWVMDRVECMNMAVLAAYEYRLANEMAHEKAWSAEKQELIDMRLKEPLTEILHEFYYKECGMMCTNVDFGLKLLRQELGKILQYDQMRADDRERLKELLGEELLDGESPGFKLWQPQPETVQRFAEWLRRGLEPYRKYMPQKAEYGADDALLMLHNILTDTELVGKTEYRAELDEEGLEFEIDPNERKIYVPEQKFSDGCSREEFETEVLGVAFGVKLRQALAFEQCEVKSFVTGLPESMVFQRGLEMVVRQALQGSIEISGLDSRISAGLALGRGLDFRGVFEVWRMLKFYGYLMEADKIEREILWRQAEREAFRQTERCFRGTGSVVNHGMLWERAGAEKVWQMIAENLNSPEKLSLLLFQSGRSNPTCPPNLRMLNLLKSGELTGEGFQARKLLMIP